MILGFKLTYTPNVYRQLLNIFNIFKNGLTTA